MDHNYPPGARKSQCFPSFCYFYPQIDVFTCWFNHSLLLKNLFFCWRWEQTDGEPESSNTQLHAGVRSDVLQLQVRQLRTPGRVCVYGAQVETNHPHRLTLVTHFLGWGSSLFTCLLAVLCLNGLAPPGRVSPTCLTKVSVQLKLHHGWINRARVNVL